VTTERRREERETKREEDEEARRTGKGGKVQRGPDQKDSHKLLVHDKKQEDN
jgi:hypothetical protein